MKIKFLFTSAIIFELIFFSHQRIIFNFIPLLQIVIYNSKQIDFFALRIVFLDSQMKPHESWPMKPNFFYFSCNFEDYNDFEIFCALLTSPYIFSGQFFMLTNQRTFNIIFLGILTHQINIFLQVIQRSIFFISNSLPNFLNIHRFLNTS